MTTNSKYGDAAFPARPQPLVIRVLIGQQGDQWIAQALDRDIATQAPSREAVKASFVRMLRARMQRDIEHGREPLRDLPPAPERFFETWKRLEEHEDEFKTSAAGSKGDLPPVYVIHGITYDPADLAA